MFQVYLIENVIVKRILSLESAYHSLRTTVLE